MCDIIKIEQTIWSVLVLDLKRSELHTVYWPAFSNLRFESCVNSKYSKTELLSMPKVEGLRAV